MADATITPFIQKIADYTITGIVQEFKYLFHYSSNMRNLGTRAKDLDNKRISMERLVKEAKDNALIIKPEVETWLQKVDNLKKEVEEAFNHATNSEMQCLFLRCPNLKTRYFLSRKASKKTIAIVELLDEASKLDKDIGTRPPREILSFHGSEGLDTRIKTKKEIIRALDGTNVSVVGICGMPGVGKTTMAREIITDVVKDGLFNEVAMAVVSKDVNITKIQDQLAEMLGLRFEEKTENARAERLHQRFTMDKKKILVVLDDLWREVELKTIGIPSREGLKVLLTSRYENVCKNMGAMRSTFEVGLLPKNEAFLLFQEAAGIPNDDNTQLKSIAEQVAEQCKGLPLALKVVGSTLKNCRIHAWEDALHQLQNSRLDDELFSSIEWSYNYLKNDEQRFLLLLCSLFAEDEHIRIETLVQYAHGLDLFRDTKTLFQSRNRAYTISDHLKNCHLLLSGQTDDEVKLHDVIRDFCLFVTSNDKTRYMVRHDGFTEWPEHDDGTHDSYDAISVSFSGQEVHLPSRLPYGNLKLLRIVNQYGLPYYDDNWFQYFKHPSSTNYNKISAEFFDDMHKLRVVHFSNVIIPSSVRFSTGLRTLCLDYCWIDFKMSVFMSLKKLEILSLYSSRLTKDIFDVVGAYDSNMRSLDLRFHYGPSTLLSLLISRMKKLEELYLGYYFDPPFEEKDNMIEVASSLKALKTLQIWTDNDMFLTELLQQLNIDQLEKFEISTDSHVIISEKKSHFRRSLHLYHVYRSTVSQTEIKKLMKRSDCLALSVKGLKNLVNELDEDGFTQLKSLKLDNCDFEYMINATESIPRGTFGKLEFLHLYRLHEMKEICNAKRGVHEPPVLSNLLVIEVVECHNLRYLFSTSVVNSLEALESLTVKVCQEMEEIIRAKKDEEDNSDSEIKMVERGTASKIMFPKLRSIHLVGLTRFKMFCSLNCELVFPSLDTLKIEGCLGMKKFCPGELNAPKLQQRTDILP